MCAAKEFRSNKRNGFFNDVTAEATLWIGMLLLNYKKLILEIRQILFTFILYFDAGADYLITVWASIPICYPFRLSALSLWQKMRNFLKRLFRFGSSTLSSRSKFPWNLHCLRFSSRWTFSLRTLISRTFRRILIVAFSVITPHDGSCVNTLILLETYCLSNINQRILNLEHVVLCFVFHQEKWI